jgi:amidase
VAAWRRWLLAGVIAAACPLPVFPSGGANGFAQAAFPLEEATITDLQSRMREGTLTSRELTLAYLGRIADLDKSGPRLNAVIELNPDALEAAEASDAERRAGHVRGPLHGIPVLIKDNIATADRMQTTAGSLALVGARPRADAALVARLRAAGAVLLGKTNLSEWANFRSSASTSGWSGRGGQTLNPYALDRDPDGSSSGSAVAVSANLCAVAVGTETNGSIVSPSSVCGIVGIKPTVGLISRSGIIPVSFSQDTAGPMARTVRDAAILLGALAGGDPADPATAGRPPGYSTDYLGGLARDGLKGARIGVVDGTFGFNPRMEPIKARAVEALRAAGAAIVEHVELPKTDQLQQAEFEVLLYEFKDGLNRYLSTLAPGAPVTSLADIIRFDDAHRSREMPYFGQEVFLKAQGKGPLAESAYSQARVYCLRVARAEGIDAVMAAQRLDALVAMTSGPAWTLDPVNGDPDTGGSSSFAAIAGYPNVTVPADQVLGLPVGISFFGRAWSEGTLLRLAADFEEKTHARRPPRFLPTVDLSGGEDVSRN